MITRPLFFAKLESMNRNWFREKKFKGKKEMIKIRRSKERGHANYGWLDTNYTFSFSNYYDPRFMGFRSLRVINEDFIAPNQGFPTHGHRDMEILTYVIRGEISHKDSMGNGTTILPHEVQRMTAGTGILHSEYSSPSEETHLLQIWILPEEEIAFDFALGHAIEVGQL